MQQLDIESIGEYAIGYAAKLCTEYFSKGYHLSGEDIVSACEVRQVNMLIVKDIFLDWKQQTNALKNSYFDYSHPEVVKILEQLTSELSRHILMPVETYEFFLAKAVKETIYYCLDPHSYLFELIEIFSDQNVVDNQEVFDVLKYLSLHPELQQAIAKDIELCGTMIFIRDLIDIIEFRCSDKKLLQNTDGILQQFKDYFDFEIGNWWIKSADDELVGHAVKPEEESFEPLVSHESHSLPELETSEIAPIQSPQIPSQQANESRFVDILFGSNLQDYEAAMQKIEEFSSYSEAVNYLKSTYAKKYNWESSSVLSDFLDEIDSRFD